MVVYKESMVCVRQKVLIWESKEKLTDSTETKLYFFVVYRLELIVLVYEFFISHLEFFFLNCNLFLKAIFILLRDLLEDEKEAWEINELHFILYLK